MKLTRIFLVLSLLTFGLAQADKCGCNAPKPAAKPAAPQPKPTNNAKEMPKPIKHKSADAAPAAEEKPEAKA